MRGMNRVYGYPIMKARKNFAGEGIVIYMVITWYIAASKKLSS